MDMDCITSGLDETAWNDFVCYWMVVTHLEGLMGVKPENSHELKSLKALFVWAWYTNQVNYRYTQTHELINIIRMVLILR